jgi:large subunit ribosomal protein L21
MGNGDIKEYKMIAVVETGGKQYQISPGSIIRIEKLKAKEGEEVVLDKVLMIKEDDSEALIGNPLIAKARVTAEVLRQDRAKKIIVYKFKRRKGYHRKYGHRQAFTELKIKEIQSGKTKKKAK